jgi:hypothetical protein
MTAQTNPVNAKNQADVALAEFLSYLRDKPLEYVMAMFPWDSEPSIQMVPLPEEYKGRFDTKYGPDKWQCEFLDDLGKQIRQNAFDGSKPVKPLRFSTVTGHGTGKSTLTAWLIKFVMDTRPYSMGSVTANTDEQLRSKTWAELGKWHNMSLTRDWFTYSNTQGNMRLCHASELKDRWSVAAKTCRPEKSEAFAGQHAPMATSFYIFDEASGVPDKFYEVREGGLGSGEPMIFDFGNGTRNTGMFFENCVGKHAYRYSMRSIDSRECYLPNKETIEANIEAYGGEESDWVKVRYRGLFPDASSLQFINSMEVAAAMERKAPEAHELRHEPIIIGVDVARSGNDASVIYPRVGYDCRTFAPKMLYGASADLLVDEVVAMVRMFERVGRKVAMINVDGTGMGGPVVDFLRKAGLVNVNDINSGRTAANPKMYRLVCDELMGKLRDAIPDIVLPARHTQLGTRLYDQLTQREFGYNMKGQIVLESKDMFKTRIGGSPDEADALALTFIRDVSYSRTAESSHEDYSNKLAMAHDYDPLDAANEAIGLN